jgi:limonene-1,2-epoxide hydrolase
MIDLDLAQDNCSRPPRVGGFCVVDHAVLFRKLWRMTTQEVANKVVELTRKQAWREALDTLYSNDIVSVEPRAMEGSPETHGIEGVRGKVDWWTTQMETHSVKVDGPFVAHDRFVVRYDIDVTDKQTNERMQLSEVGVYTVKDGKIVREEFLPYMGKHS